MAERPLTTWGQMAAVGAALTAPCIFVLVNNRWGAWGLVASVAPPAVGWPIFLVLWWRSSIAAEAEAERVKKEAEDVRLAAEAEAGKLRAEVEAAKVDAEKADLRPCTNCHGYYPQRELEVIEPNERWLCGNSGCSGVVPSGEPREAP